MRAIDADALRHEIHCWYSDDLEILEHIDAQPTIQPEIVRCKDCKHRDPEDKKCDCGHDILWQLPRRDDWFCADGERRE